MAPLSLQIRLLTILKKNGSKRASLSTIKSAVASTKCYLPRQSKHAEKTSGNNMESAMTLLCLSSAVTEWLGKKLMKSSVVFVNMMRYSKKLFLCFSVLSCLLIQILCSLFFSLLSYLYLLFLYYHFPLRIQ